MNGLVAFFVILAAAGTEKSKQRKDSPASLTSGGAVHATSKEGNRPAANKRNDKIRRTEAVAPR